VLASWLADETDRRLRFEREARAAARLSHPNLVAIFDVGEHQGTPFLVTELLPGETLQRVLQRGPLPPTRTLALGLQLAAGLAAAHAAGVIHRDLKPGNVMVLPGDRLKILDFGLARLVGGDENGPAELSLTRDGALLGTLGYVSPEVVAGRPADARSDVFAAGALLYEMLSGRAAFRRANAAETLAAISRDEPPRIENAVEEPAPGLISLARRCLRKRPEERFATGAELSAALERLAGGAAVAARSSPAHSGADTPLPVLDAVAEQPTRAQERPSVAVLPFADTSPGRDQEYFCDGITEELIHALARIPELRVAARTSSFAFKGSAQDAREVARRLGVTSLVEGSVRSAGDRLRVTVQLVDASHGYQVWTGRYDRRMEDVFLVQDEIAHAIVENLRVRLLGPAPVARPASSLEAYKLFLLGRHHWNRQTEGELDRAIELFRRAAAVEPSFAPAWTGVAEALCLLVNWGSRAPQEVMPQAREAASRALALDETEAGAHSAMGVIETLLHYDWVASERQHRRALELRPGDATIRMYYAMSCLCPQGRHEEGLEQMRRAAEADPISPFIGLCHAWASWVARRHLEAEALCRQVLQLEPHFHLAHWTLGLVLEQQGRLAAALEAVEAARALSGDAPLILGELGRLRALHGDRAGAEELLAQLEGLAEGRYVSALDRAVVHLGLGESDRALEWLERAYEERGNQLYWIKVNPRFDRLREHPRLKALLARMRLA